MKKLLVSLFFLITTLLFAQETTQTKGAYVDTSLLGKFSQVLGSSLIENTVVIILVVFFAIVIFIIFYKYSYLKQTQKQSDEFLVIFWRERENFKNIYDFAIKLKASPVANIFIAGYQEIEKMKETDNKDIDFLVRTIKKTISVETNKIESLVHFLATTGSSAPFIGLFGTVCGIMATMVKSSIALNEMQSRVGNALAATAIGLIAAIPAVVAFNYFSNKVKLQISEMENFQNDFLNVAKRYLSIK